MKYLLLAVFGICSFIGFSQAELNNYKYVIVPKHFDDFKKTNQYNTSTKVKHLLSQKGFHAVYDDALPGDLVKNRCLGVAVKMENKSSMFSTKVGLKFIDCFSKTVYTTQEGKSKIKEYNEAYSDAIKKALSSLNGFTYEYTAKVDEKPMVVSFKNDVKKLDNTKEEVQEKAEMKKEGHIEQVATKENQSFKDLSPKPSNIKKAAVVPTGILYSQEMPYGYQLVDSTPKVVMKLYKTTLDNVFMVQGSNAIVHKKDEQWVYEYETDGKTETKVILIKF